MNGIILYIYTLWYSCWLKKYSQNLKVESYFIWWEHLGLRLRRQAGGEQREQAVWKHSMYGKMQAPGLTEFIPFTCTSPTPSLFMQVQSLGQENTLEKEMATHSSILAWRIPWPEELGRLQSTGSQKSRTWVSDSTTIYVSHKIYIIII